MQLLLGTMQDKLKELPDNSVDSVVTDPPYGISFMNKKWDYGVPTAEMWEEVYRVLKPGGHVLSFSSARTYHRSTVEIEDAGFEIRDQVMWVYGSGFPKSHNIGKAVDKKLGNSREVLGENPNHRTSDALFELGFQGGKGDGKVTKGSSEWEGWGTALKPAHEPITLARKPLDEKTIVDNVLRWGTGGLNIDASRVPYSDDNPMPEMKGDVNRYPTSYGKGLEEVYQGTPGSPDGRYPANFIHDGIEEDWGRYFYVPKVSKAERNAGLDSELPSIGGMDKAYVEKRTEEHGIRTADSRALFDKKAEELKAQGVLANTHPTVKPIALMSYLIKMVTPPGGTVLDPFMGSGSTGCAAVSNGFDFIGIEMEEHSFDVAKARMEYWEK